MSISICRLIRDELETGHILVLSRYPVTAWRIAHARPLVDLMATLAMLCRQGRKRSTRLGADIVIACRYATELAEGLRGTYGGTSHERHSRKDNLNGIPWTWVYASALTRVVLQLTKCSQSTIAKSIKEGHAVLTAQRRLIVP